MTACRIDEKHTTLTLTSLALVPSGKLQDFASAYHDNPKHGLLRRADRHAKHFVPNKLLIALCNVNPASKHKSTVLEPNP